MVKDQLMAKYYNFNSSDYGYQLSYVRYIRDYDALKKPPMDFNTFSVNKNTVYQQILGSAKYMTGLNFFPEQLYNSILPMTQLPDGTVLKTNFEYNSNSLEYDSIGLNIKSGYIRSPEKENNWGSFVKYEDELSNTGHLPGDRNTLDTSNPILHLPVSETQLMIKDSYIQKGVTTSLDLIYGTPDIGKMKALREQNTTTRTYAYKTKSYYEDPIRSSYKIQYNYNHHATPTNNWMTIPVTTRSGGKFRFSLEHKGILRHAVLAGIEINDRKKYEKFTTRVNYYGVTWRSIKEKENVLPRGGKKLVDSFSELSVTSGVRGGAYYYREEHDTRHSKTESVVAKRNYEYLYTVKVDGTGHDKYHFQSIYGSNYNKEDRLKTKLFNHSTTTGAQFDEINKIYNSAKLENINWLVLITLLKNRLEQAWIKDPNSVFGDEDLTTDEFRKKDHVNKDISHLIPEVTTGGITLMVNMMKKKISQDVTELKPMLVGYNGTHVSQFELDRIDYLCYWMFKLYLACDSEPMIDKEHYPYYVPHLRDDEGNDIDSIRMDISRGKDCIYLIPHLETKNINFKAMDKDELMLKYSEYMLILAPIFKNIELEVDKPAVLDYCYPIIHVIQYLFPEVYGTLFKKEIPKYVDGLERKVSVYALLTIIKAIDRKINDDLTHEFSPANFERRAMLKDIGIWDKVDKVDFNRTLLPKISSESLVRGDKVLQYNIIKDGETTKLANVSLGEKLHMLQNASDMLATADQDDSVTLNKLHSMYIMPIVLSLKKDELMNEVILSDRLDGMLELKGKLDYIRDTELTFLRKRKETIIALFNGQRSTLKDVLIKEKKAQDDFFNNISDPLLDRTPVEYTVLSEVDMEDKLDDLDDQVDVTLDSNQLKDKLALSAVAGIGLSVAAKVVKSILSRKKGG